MFVSAATLLSKSPSPTSDENMVDVDETICFASNLTLADKRNTGSTSTHTPLQPLSSLSSSSSSLSSSASASSPAVEQVLCTVDWATSEMLLQILQFLSPTELAVTRLVSHIWRATSDSNLLWKHVCSDRWPSCVKDPVKSAIEASGGFRTYYVNSLPRRRSKLSDIIITLDVCSTSYAYFSVVEAIAGIAFNLKDATWDNGRLVMKPKVPWKVNQKPYRFKTLTDILGSPIEGEDTSPLCMPELRLKLGAMHTKFARRTHVATLEEGMNVRTRVWYEALNREAADTSDTPPVIGQNNDNNNNSNVDSQTNVRVNISESEPKVDPKPSLTFSGQLLLPQLYNGNAQHLVDVQLFGDHTTLPSKVVSHQIREVHLGPFFNTLQLNGLESMVATCDDVVDMLDLKFGIFAEDQLTDLGKPTF